ncbi:NAD binding domain of 6-phosphogluconate dehydrogenase-domain-containing protein [Naematelia encephala]|uniref:NAD binding domain of 6-phosphogluconate dehydrogenase-domain-containing protein n=1 Tax=Naematelia encephala TaxID=71784 RepID=A0A1Y2BI15_9TREE|nr:NAD binding domain of 6-phosphogluconate dehydrogenase-domain-containing protein [Naematelia encephala]
MDRPTIGWIGLGAMGGGMASALASQGFHIKTFDVWKPSLDAAGKAGAIIVDSPASAATGVQVLALMVVNAAQVEDLLFGSGGVAEVLEPGSSIVCFSTVPPTFLVTIKNRLDALEKGIGLCDSPVSGGSTRAAQGTLSIMVSGRSQAISRARPLLDAVTCQPEGKLAVVGEDVGTASNFKLINQVFCAIQIAAPSEAMAFGKALGLNPRLLYKVIRTASGDSFMFGHRTPWMLRDDGIPKSAMTIIAKDIGIVMDDARMNAFPAPLCSMVEQVYTAALGAGMNREDDGLLIRMWQFFGGQSVQESGTEEEEEENAKELTVSSETRPSQVLVVGLGAMGFGIAKAIQSAGIKVIGNDVDVAAIDRFSASGGSTTSDVNGPALPANSTIVVMSTIAPSSAIAFQSRLDAQGRGLQVVDAPVSGGPTRAVSGDLAVFASGSTAGLKAADAVLRAVSLTSGSTQNLHYIPGGVGSGSKVKIVNNLLAGIHLCAAAEALALARKKNMDLRQVFEIVSKGAGSSYVMIDRIPRMWMKDPPVMSATETFVKDLGIALAEGKRTNTPLWLAAAAHQQFIRAVAHGWGREDDSCVGRLWEPMGISVVL